MCAQNEWFYWRLLRIQFKIPCANVCVCVCWFINEAAATISHMIVSFKMKRNEGFRSHVICQWHAFISHCGRCYAQAIHKWIITYTENYCGLTVENLSLYADIIEFKFEFNANIWAIILECSVADRCNCLFDCILTYVEALTALAFVPENKMRNVWHIATAGEKRSANARDELRKYKFLATNVFPFFLSYECSYKKKWTVWAIFKLIENTWTTNSWAVESSKKMRRLTTKCCFTKCRHNSNWFSNDLNEVKRGWARKKWIYLNES